MYRVGKIECVCTCRQNLYVAVWSKHVHFVGVADILAYEVKKFLTVAEIVVVTKHFLDPAQFVVHRRHAGNSFLILPVRRDTVFSHFVHFVGTDLHFDGVTVPLKLDKHRRMQRLVQVGLGDGDIVLEAAGHRLPLCVDCAQHGVAVLYRIDNHAHRRQVVYLVQRFVLFLHLAVNAVQVFDAAVNIKVFYACFGKFNAHLPDKVVYYFVTFLLFEGDTFGNTEVCVGIEILKAQVFQLALDLRHTESACNRREDFQCFLCRALLLFGNHVLQTAHVVQAVR